mgnify:CR=1 FL=1
MSPSPCSLLFSRSAYQLAKCDEQTELRKLAAHPRRPLGPPAAFFESSVSPSALLFCVSGSNPTGTFSNETSPKNRNHLGLGLGGGLCPAEVSSYFALRNVFSQVLFRLHLRFTILFDLTTRTFP